MSSPKTVRILYGVVGEGMGHATRSRVVIEHLLQRGHRVRVIVSGRAHQFLRERLGNYPLATLEEIQGFRLVYRNNRLAKSDSLLSQLKDAPHDLAQNLRVYRRVAEDGMQPELVISDFETWAALYAINHFLPVISIDNMQIITRCHHPPEVNGSPSFTRGLTRFAVNIRVPGVSHYLITTFFFPRVAKPRTTLVPPILRREIIEARREPGEHVVVYQTSGSNEELVPALRRLGHEFRVYGMGRVGTEGNVTLRAFSEAGFVEDLRTARAVIAGGGFTVLSEAVSLGVPILSVPIELQYEQELNARYLAYLGYGGWAPALDLDVISSFLARTDEYAHALAGFPRPDNTMVFACLDELLDRAGRGDLRPAWLESQSMGKWLPLRLP
ncbi:MAG: teichoic acid biosynthesis protein [Polyangiaceae bacterium]|nr:teichoic acid biosynthesis protein [Polyangiaceae bacterium]